MGQCRMYICEGKLLQQLPPQILSPLSCAQNICQTPGLERLADRQRPRLVPPSSILHQPTTSPCLLWLSSAETRSKCLLSCVCETGLERKATRGDFLLQTSRACLFQNIYKSQNALLFDTFSLQGEDTVNHSPLISIEKDKKITILLICSCWVTIVCTKR